MGKKYGQLQASERDQIAILKARGDSAAVIAEKIGRGVATIYKELKRNAGPDNEYMPSFAQERATKRRSAGSARPLMKNAWIRAHVSQKLVLGWSPGRISGRLAKEHPGEWGRNISAEAIYNYIYSDEADTGMR